jgi:hypothetical protein
VPIFDIVRTDDPIGVYVLENVIVPPAVNNNDCGFNPVAVYPATGFHVILYVPVFLLVRLTDPVPD